jgi:hypothetical protein
MNSTYGKLTISDYGRELLIEQLNNGYNERQALSLVFAKDAMQCALHFYTGEPFGSMADFQNWLETECAWFPPDTTFTIAYTNLIGVAGSILIDDLVLIHIPRGVIKYAPQSTDSVPGATAVSE